MWQIHERLLYLREEWSIVCSLYAGSTSAAWTSCRLETFWGWWVQYLQPRLWATGWRGDSSEPRIWKPTWAIQWNLTSKPDQHTYNEGWGRKEARGEKHPICTRSFLSSGLANNTVQNLFMYMLHCTGYYRLSVPYPNLKRSKTSNWMLMWSSDSLLWQHFWFWVRHAQPLVYFRI